MVLSLIFIFPIQLWYSSSPISSRRWVYRRHLLLGLWVTMSLVSSSMSRVSICTISNTYFVNMWLESKLMISFCLVLIGFCICVSLFPLTSSIRFSNTPTFLISIFLQVDNIVLSFLPSLSMYGERWILASKSVSSIS